MKRCSRTLDFFNEEMIGKEGAYYYFDHEKKQPFVTGLAISNSWALLAFLDGYEYLKDREYLTAAKKVAKYSIKNLYDWNSGGFFEKNSKDYDLYGPGEHISLLKPYRENAVFSYALLRLHHSTYLISGLMLIVLGALIFNGYLYRLNNIALQTDYVQDIILEGEEYLRNLLIR